MNKKGQWAHAAARERRSLDRAVRKKYARALTNLGFSLNEIINFLNVSSNTIKAYLNETEGENYSDLFDFALNEDVFELFTKKEQNFLRTLKDNTDLSQELTKKSKEISDTICGVGLFNFLQKVFSDVEELKKKQKEINQQILTLAKTSKKMSAEFKNKKKYPHLSKSHLILSVEVKQTWSCEFCREPFNSRKSAEKHEESCKQKKGKD